MKLTLKEIKDELKEYHCNQTIINEYEKNNGKIEDLFEKATKITSVISDMPNGVSTIQDKKAELVSKYVDLQNENMELEEKYNLGLLKLKNRNLVIHDTIMKMNNPYKAILIHIYENNYTRDRAAEVMEMSRKWIDTKIGIALIEYHKLRNERLEICKANISASFLKERQSNEVK